MGVDAVGHIELALGDADALSSRHGVYHCVPAWASALPPIDVVTQCLVNHGLKRAALRFGDLAQSCQHFRRSLGGELFADYGGHDGIGFGQTRAS